MVIVMRVGSEPAGINAEYTATGLFA